MVPPIPADSQLEQKLTQFYSQQIDGYQAILRRMEQLPQKFEAGAPVETELHELRRALEQLSRNDREITSWKDAWKSRNQRPGAALEQSLRTAEQVILQAMEHLDAAERAAQEAKQRLQPSASEVSRRQAMRIAYASARRQG